MGEQRALIEPPVGNPPTLEWIAAERLAIDESYQRATDSKRSRSLIFNIGKRWNWSYCQPLVVSRRADGSLYVIDGQHRLSAALQRGDIMHLPCVVLHGQEGASEAQAFVALNTQRQRLSQSDIFNALLASGDEAAKHVTEILRETGWRQTRAQNPTVGTLICAPMIVKAAKLYGEPVVRNALTALREAYPEKPVGKMSLLLKALFLVFKENRASDDPDVLISALAEVEPDDWEMHGHDARRADVSLSRIEGVAQAITDAYRDMLPTGLEVAA
jgi:hypothetical protein